MTEAEFLALPKRERDALVAGHVMRWAITPLSFQPTTDIAAAWEVVEKVDMPWCIDRHGDEWSASTEGWCIATANAAPLAICLAALKAVGAVE